jgi:vitamin B12 transporter
MRVRALLPCLTCFLVAHGEDPARLAPVVVTATRQAEPLADVSATVQVMTQEQIKLSAARNVGDLLVEAGVGHVTKYNGALTGSIQVRGLSTDLFKDASSRVLILVNGSRAGTVNLAKLPVEDIERIEIVKGPGSVLYGTSAMGGVINIITRRGRGEMQASLAVQGGAYQLRRAEADVAGAKGAFDYFLTASRESQGDYAAPRIGTLVNSAWKAETLSTRMGLEVAPGHRIQAGFQHWKGWDIGSQGATYSPDPDDFNDKKRDSFDLEYQTGGFQARAFQVQDDDVWHSTGGMGSGPGNSDISRASTHTFGGNLQQALRMGAHRLVVGGQWERIEVESSRNAGAPYYPDSKYENGAVFAEGRLTADGGRLMGNLGVRHDWFRNQILPTAGIQGLVPREDSLGHTTVRGGIVWKALEGLSLRTSAGSAFRAPAPLELAADYQAWGTHYRGNPDLRPEQSVSWDLGATLERGALRLDGAVFRTWFRDKIVAATDYAAKVSTYRNAGKADITGLEMQAGVVLGRGGSVSWEPYLTASFLGHAYEETQGKDVDLAYTPKRTASFGLRITGSDWDLRLQGGTTGPSLATDWNDASPTAYQTIQKGGFSTFQAKGTWRPTRHLEVSLGIENLMNRYYEHNLGYPMAGRNATAGIRLTF